MAIEKTELMEHYLLGKQEMERRKTRKNGWDDVLKSFFGVLPVNWPYLSRLVDPVLRTIVIEKNARLLNGKLRGTLVPREGGDVIKAKINNAILDYQWDKANKDGTMMDKVSLSDIQTRLFGASFGLVYWDAEKECNEFKVLDNRNVFPDFQASDINSCKWIQVREWVALEDLEEQNEHLPEEMKFQNLEEIKKKLSKKVGNRRDNAYTSPIKQAHGVEDMVGRDRAFPMIELVTEYRHEKWITFAPQHQFILREIDNPRDDEMIPVVMLRYYYIGDDIYGDIEVESVLPLQRGVNAMLSGFIDHTSITIRPPIKVANNSTVRLDTLSYGPNAIWLTGDSINNVATHQTGSDQVIGSFQSSYQVLKSAINAAMGETSLGISNVTPFDESKTATEVKSTDRQRLTRDQRNQIALEQFLSSIMMLWLGNNKQFLFSDPSKNVLVQRIVGREILEDLKALGLAEREIPKEATDMMRDMVEQTDGEMSDQELQLIAEETSVPRYPVIMNPNEKNPEKYDVRSKLEMDEAGSFAQLLVTPDDLEGVYDYIPSVKSMAANETDRMIAGRNQALQLALNPVVKQSLMEEGFKVKVKDILMEVFEDQSVKSPEKLFEPINQNPQVMNNMNAMGTNPMQQPTDMGMEASGSMEAI